MERMKKVQKTSLSHVHITWISCGEEKLANQTQRFSNCKDIALKAEWKWKRGDDSSDDGKLATLSEQFPLSFKGIVTSGADSGKPSTASSQLCLQ